MLYWRQMRFLLLACLILAAASAATSQCPTVTVVGPEGITVPGEEMTFRAVVGPTTSKLAYSWMISAGTIVKGQGTPKITVVTAREHAGSSITATVKLEGLSISCERSASETAGVAPVPGCGLPLDQWSNLKPNDERGRLDLLFAELSNNPKDVGLLIFTVKPGDRLDAGNKRIQFVLKHARFREFDKGRLLFGLVVGDKSTTLYRIPPGAEPPCSDCLIFRGESL